MIINEVTLLGHKDHGKSTLIGNILIFTKSVTKARIESAKAMSKRLGRAFEPGFLLDSFEEEQEDAMTIDTTRAQIKYKGKGFEFIDVPGHEELIKNMISGASHARFAILVVSAKPEEGISPQTKRHLFIAKMMGIRSIAVCVNKMDTVDYDRGIFDSISTELGSFLKVIGFGGDSIFFVPVSAYTGENIVACSRKMQWYKGRPLLDILAELSVSRKLAHEPVRFIFQGSIDAGGKRAYIGKLASGNIRRGEKIAVSPIRRRFSVETIFIKGRMALVAKRGENAAFVLAPEPKTNLRGMVGCTADNVIDGKRELNALIFSVDRLPKKGKIRVNGADHNCVINVRAEIDTSDGKPKKSSVIRPLEAGEAVIRLKEPICVEPFSISEEIGRFTIYDKERFVGFGIVK